MTIFTIALLQMSAGEDQEINKLKGEVFCRRAHQLGADLALFPEMWSNGYRLFDPAGEQTLEQWAAQAVGLEDAFVVHFCRLATELKMAIALTYLERWQGLPRNTITLFDRHGEALLTYAKVHTCDFDKEIHLTPGSDFCVCDLDFGAGTVKLGAMICFDREFPESARLLMLKGAEIILTPNACELEQNRLSQFRARAYENMTGMAMANYPPPQGNGHSVAYSGMAFDREEHSLDMTLVEAGQDEGVYLARFDLEALRNYRSHEVWGNAYRRPRLYSTLTAQEVTEPFDRKRVRR